MMANIVDIYKMVSMKMAQALKHSWTHQIEDAKK